MAFKTYKSLGQNFLTNRRIVERIVESAALSGDESVVEVGPGKGILTEALLKNARKVIAIEKDRRLFDLLKENFANAKNLELIWADALQIAPPKTQYSLVANIPYSITSPLLDHFIRDNPANLPKTAVLLVQKEVAKKICARPPHMNVLALHVQTFGNPKIISTVSKNNFNPRPKVDSAIIKIEFPEKPKIAVDYEKYFESIHRAFAHKRKMLRGVFGEESLKKAGIEGTRRPETLTVEDWGTIVR